MTTKPKFKSDAFEAIHSAAQGLHRAGAIEKATLRDFDVSCLAERDDAEAPGDRRVARLEDAGLNACECARPMRASRR